MNYFQGYWDPHCVKKLLLYEIPTSMKGYTFSYLIKEIQPLAPIFSRIETYKKKNLIMISVWEGASKPYSFKNNIFIRKYSQTIKSKNAISTLLNEKLNNEQRWERQSVLGASLEDLDFDEIQNSIIAYKNYSSNNNFTTPEEFLINRGLIVNGNITNACMVLFGKNPTQFIPQSIIKFVVHPGTKSSDRFKANKIYNGNLFRNVEQILSDFDRSLICILLKNNMLLTTLILLW